MSRLATAAPEAVIRDHPEWGPWLALLAEAQRALDEPHWLDALPADDEAAAARPALAPRLHRVVLAVDPEKVTRFIRRLFQVAGADGSAAALRAAARDDRPASLGLLEAAICQDATHLDGWAPSLGVQPDLLGTIADLAAIPLLRACGRAWKDQLPPHWRAGYCPMCGAWPTLAEARGLERSRRLRCGRCGGDWRTDWLRCPYCGTVEHGRLGSLVVDAVETRRVETCATCRGYVKTVTTLTGTAADAVALIDLATVELDLAAIRHGYARPRAPAYALDARVVAKRS